MDINNKPMDIPTRPRLRVLEYSSKEDPYAVIGYLREIWRENAVWTCWIADGGVAGQKRWRTMDVVSRLD